MEQLLAKISECSGYERDFYVWENLPPDELFDQLSLLHDKQILNDEEFAAVKAKIIK